MKNYKECTDDEYSATMKTMHEVAAGKTPLSDVPASALNIIITKMDADAAYLKSVGSSYASGLGSKSQNTADAFRCELDRRNALQ